MKINMRACRFWSSYFLPINIKAKRKRVVRESTIRSIFAPRGKSIGFIKAVIPSIHKILNMLLPTIFPTARSTFFLRAATTEVTNSGKEVPKAITVAEMRKSLKPKFLAITIAPFTVQVPQIYKPMSHHMINREDFRTGSVSIDFLIAISWLIFLLSCILS